MRNLIADFRCTALISWPSAMLAMSRADSTACKQVRQAKSPIAQLSHKPNSPPFQRLRKQAIDVGPLSTKRIARGFWFGFGRGWDVVTLKVQT
eukprot:1449614-Amphidinium_carterae.1